MNISDVEKIFGNSAFRKLGPEPDPNPSTGIIHCKLSVAELDNKISFDIYQDPTFYRQGISSFLDDLVNRTNNSVNEHTYDKPFSINIENQCHLVLELDAPIKWRFWPTWACATIEDNKADKYGGLNHVYVADIPGGRKRAIAVGDTSPMEDYKCTILYFTITKVPKYLVDVDKLNLWVSFDQSSKSVPCVVDPDIKNSGPPP